MSKFGLEDLERSFWERVDKTGEFPDAGDSLVAESARSSRCWIWTGARGRLGYGRIYYWEFGNRMAHRYSCHLAGLLSWDQVISPSGDDVVDHLCRVTSCVNPAHLEVVNASENKRRGASNPYGTGLKSQCPAGHQMDDGNIGRNAKGWVYCKQCNADRSNALYHNRRGDAEWYEARMARASKNRRIARLRKAIDFEVEHGRPPVRGTPRKSECLRGHPLSGDNLYTGPSGDLRSCRTCKSMHKRGEIGKKG